MTEDEKFDAAVSKAEAMGLVRSEGELIFITDEGAEIADLMWSIVEARDEEEGKS